MKAEMKHVRPCEHCDWDGFMMGADGPYICGVCHGEGKKMRQVDYEYTVKVRVELTRSEIDHAITMSQSHYDSVCRQASEPGPNAFLNAFKTRLFDGEEDKATQVLSFRELDILSKILELPGSDMRLQASVVSILKNLSEVQRKVADLEMPVTPTETPQELGSLVNIS